MKIRFKKDSLDYYGVDAVKLTTLEKIVLGGLATATTIMTVGTISIWVYLIKEYDN